MSNDGMSIYSVRIPQWPWSMKPQGKNKPTKEGTGQSPTPRSERAPVFPLYPIRQTPLKSLTPIPAPVQSMLMAQAKKGKGRSKGELKKEDFRNDGILPDLFNAPKTSKEKAWDRLNNWYKLKYGDYIEELPNKEEQLKEEAKRKKLESLPLPEYKGTGGLKELLEFNEKLKQRLRDAGETVPESPYDQKPPTTPPQEKPTHPLGTGWFSESV